MYTMHYYIVSQILYTISISRYYMPPYHWWIIIEMNGCQVLGIYTIGGTGIQFGR